jgi:hypothetical protein
MSSIMAFHTKVNTPEIDSSLSKEKGIRSRLSGLAFAGCMVAGTLIGGSETAYGFSNQNLMVYRSNTPSSHQRAAQIEEGKSVPIAGNLRVIPSNFQENSAVALYSSAEMPILSYKAMEYNGETPPFSERTEASPMTKRRDVRAIYGNVTKTVEILPRKIDLANEEDDPVFHALSSLKPFKTNLTARATFKGQLPHKS